MLLSTVCYEPTGQGLLLKYVGDGDILKGCTVYVGSIFFAMYRMQSQAEVNKTTYPEMREITGFLVFNLVAGPYQTTLSLMFPNLRIIRGNQFFYGYSLLFYFDRQLTDMALPSLTKIQNGNVRIQNNANMCYHSTIQWLSLMGSSYSPERIVIKDVPANCRSCPIKCNGYCWNSDHCQICTSIHSTYLYYTYTYMY